MINFKGSQFEREIILWGVRWYVAYPISYRQLEEMMGERGVAVDHSTLNRWVIKYAPEFEKAFRRRQRPVGSSWRMDETYVRIKGKWAYLYRAVDTEGQTIDFLLTPHRDRVGATRRLSGATTRRTRRPSSFATPNISTTSWSKTIERSNASRVLCWASNRFGQRAVRSRGLKSCMPFAKGRWRLQRTRAKHQRSSFMLWLRR
jgi:transposase-like protein